MFGNGKERNANLSVNCLHSVFPVKFSRFFSRLFNSHFRAKKNEHLKSKPKRALSGYQIFVKEYISNNKHPSKHTKTLFSEAAGFWRGLVDFQFLIRTSLRINPCYFQS